jgi:hypothetical protein
MPSSTSLATPTVMSWHVIGPRHMPAHGEEQTGGAGNSSARHAKMQSHGYVVVTPLQLADGYIYLLSCFLLLPIAGLLIII